MKKPIIYYRDVFGATSVPTDKEFEIASRHLPVTNSRMDCQDNLVIGRYSVRPFYQELENDLSKRNSHLINSFCQHYFIANFNWYEHLKEMTPRTYFALVDVPKDESRQFVVKGRTNSRKHQWDTKMFAQGYTRAAEIYHELLQDSLISDQGIIVRDYVPLKTYEIGINGLPFTNEFRFFFYKSILLTNFYYWSISEKTQGCLDEYGYALAFKAAKILSEHLNFFVIDIAQKENGGWIVIEVNDGQMSGLDKRYYDELYSQLAKAIARA